MKVAIDYVVRIICKSHNAGGLYNKQSQCACHVASNLSSILIIAIVKSLGDDTIPSYHGKLIIVSVAEVLHFKADRQITSSLNIF